ncbi:MAG: UDP binding domain-containing protein [Verrucomicrobiota bacterium]
MKIGFAGLTHLGIHYSLASADRGFETVAFQSDAVLVKNLSQGIFPVSEPGLQELWERAKQSIRYIFEPHDLRDCEVVFIALDVVTDEENRADLQPLFTLLDQVIQEMNPEGTLVVMSQVQPGFMTGLRKRWPTFQGKIFYQVETLAFGTAVERAVKPERYMVGAEKDVRSIEKLPMAYRQWLESFGCPILLMRYESAELAKIAINQYLIASVTVTNTLAAICENQGANWQEIVPALKLDRRIGPYAYLQPGLGIAGGNLERDLVAVRQMAVHGGTDDSFPIAAQTNSGWSADWAWREIQKRGLDQSDKTVSVLGLAYKIDTHSVKNSPALRLLKKIEAPSKKGWDPQVKVDSKWNLKRYEFSASASDSLKNVDAVVVMTPWKEFIPLGEKELESMRGRCVIDPMGIWEKYDLGSRGFDYVRMGLGKEKIES